MFLFRARKSVSFQPFIFLSFTLPSDLHKQAPEPSWLINPAMSQPCWAMDTNVELLSVQLARKIHHKWVRLWVWSSRVHLGNSRTARCIAGIQIHLCSSSNQDSLSCVPLHPLAYLLLPNACGGKKSWFWFWVLQVGAAAVFFTEKSCSIYGYVH